MLTKTWNEFWGMFLQVTFHKDHPERWSARQRKADWFRDNLDLKTGVKIADLGCGDGVLDILLSRMGFEVTAVDRGGPVIQNARAEDDTKKVKFVESDLQTLHFSEDSFDAILIIETLGLMNKDNDLSLLKGAFKWLKSGGSVVVDGPLNPSAQNLWERDFPTGKVVADTSFNENTRIHQLNFEFYPATGEPFTLHDPESSMHGTGAGLTRYIYSPGELTDLLVNAGFNVRREPHFNEGYYSLIGVKA